VRSVEEWGHREIDRARAESKGRAAQLKEASRLQAELQYRLERAHAALATAQQQTAVQQARADTLNQHLEQLSSAAPGRSAKRVCKSPSLKS
jgi:chromosome segregation ATPase